MSQSNQRDALPLIEPARRTALKHMAGLLGLTISAQSLDVLATSHTKDVPLAFFSQEQYKHAGVLAELIIPATETPGAYAVNVHGFMDKYATECLSKSDQQKLINLLSTLNTAAKSHYRKHFVQCTHKQQEQLLTWNEKPEKGFTNNDKAAFTLFKTVTLLGYYTSEIGATQELNYLPIPGGYKGNVPFSKIGRAWALN